MSPFKQLSDEVYSTPQIFPESMDFIAENGFKTIICNRPDMEKPGQPHSEDVKKRASELGMDYHYLPMRPGQLSLELIEATKKAIENSPKPVLMHCASGTRSAMLWCFANAKELGVDTVLNKAISAGFDVAKIRPALEQFAAQ